MKKEFNKQYILDNKGCYEPNEVLALPCINKETITLKDLADCLPINDLSWFFVNKCELTNTEKQYFALYCAKLVLPIYENKYPKDKVIRNCIEETEKFMNGDESIDISSVRSAAANAADAADADDAYDAANAADAASYAASYAAYAAVDASVAADAAAAAAYAAATIKYEIKEYIINHE